MLRLNRPMSILIHHLRPVGRLRAFSLAEVLVAVVIAGIMFLTVYAGFSSGFALLQLTRENLRATQILQEKMETIRLCNWSQINTPGFVPTNFVDTFYPGTSTAAGITYTGTVQILQAPITESYSNQLRQVTVSVQWLSGNTVRQREMSSFVSQHGLQNYIY